MIVYLTKQRNGLFMLTKFQPIKSNVGIGKDGDQDVYVPVGDPIGVRNLCDVLFQHVGCNDLKTLESKQINVRVNEISN